MVGQNPVTGTGVVPRFYSYGVNSDGSTWTQVHSGTAASPVWEKTTADLVGRTVKTEKPGYLGTETIESFYNDKGQLWKTSTLGLADTLYVYDEVGNRTRSGLDIDSSGALETASDDRISGSETMYTLYVGEWWTEETRASLPSPVHRQRRHGQNPHPADRAGSRESGFRDHE